MVCITRGRWGAGVLGSLVMAISPAVGLAQSVNDPNLVVTTHIEGTTFNGLTGMRFLGDSPEELFTIEKNPGQVRYFNNGSASTALDLNVNNATEQGLLGIELDPGFASNGHVYLF